MLVLYNLCHQLNSAIPGSSRFYCGVKQTAVIAMPLKKCKYFPHKLLQPPIPTIFVLGTMIVGSGAFSSCLRIALLCRMFSRHRFVKNLPESAVSVSDGISLEKSC